MDSILTEKSVMNAVKQYKLSENEPVHPELVKEIMDWLAKSFKA